MTLYKAIDVLERAEGRTIRYRCFQSLATGKFSVQSADFYGATTASSLDEQYVQLFSEQDPASRAGEYDSLDEAITAHKRDFA